RANAEPGCPTAALAFSLPWLHTRIFNLHSASDLGTLTTPALADAPEDAHDSRSNKTIAGPATRTTALRKRQSLAHRRAAQRLHPRIHERPSRSMAAPCPAPRENPRTDWPHCLWRELVPGELAGH